MKRTEHLLPIEIGKCVIKGQKGKVVSLEPYVKLLNDPIWNGKDWVCLAQVDFMLCLISVKPKRERNEDLSDD